MSYIPPATVSIPNVTVLALKQGCRTAFDHIYALFANKIYWVSRRLLLSDEEAKEMVQEVMLTL